VPIKIIFAQFFKASEYGSSIGTYLKWFCAANELINLGRHFLSLMPLFNKIFQTINNSSSLNKGNHDGNGLWISDLN